MPRAWSDIKETCVIVYGQGHYCYSLIEHRASETHPKSLSLYTPEQHAGNQLVLNACHRATLSAHIGRLYGRCEFQLFVAWDWFEGGMAAGMHCVAYWVKDRILYAKILRIFV